MADILILLIVYVLFVFIGAAFINGIYIVTRGETEVRPDGSRVDVDDMIFYPFYKMIMQEKPDRELIYFTGERLEDLYNRFLKMAPLPPADSINHSYVGFHSKEQDVVQLYVTAHGEIPMPHGPVELWREYGPEVAKKLGVEIIVERKKVSFYKSYKQYRYSKYVRKPLVECLKCMASFWGTLFFWPVAIMLSRYFFDVTFDWAMVPAWVIYCFMLAYVNTYLFYKAK
jgi:hypothetical protein